MHVLVAGGAGYIGSVMSETLLAAGHQVVVYDNLSHGYRDAVPEEAVWVEGDAGDQAKLERVLREHQIEAVVYMAAFIEVGESVREPRKYLDNNTLQALGVLEAMRASGVRKLVLSSTAAVYAPRSTPLDEAAPLAPASPYGLSKLFLERTLAWYDSHGLLYFALRYFNAAGATESHGERHQPESHLIPLVLEAAAGEREAIQIFGTDYDTPDGTCIRDYVHVSDLAQAHLLALGELEREATEARREKRGERDGRIPDLAERAFNLGNGAGFSVREVIAAAERVCGREIRSIARPRRGGDVDRLVASSDKMKALGWRPQYASLEDMVGSAWEWKMRRRESTSAGR